MRTYQTHSPLLWLAAAGFLLALPQLEGIIRPLLTGLCIALYLEPSCSLAERLLKPLPLSPHRRRQLAVTAACLLWGSGALAVCWLAGPALSQSLRQAAGMLPTLMEQAEQLCQRVTGRATSLPQLPGDLLAGALPSLTAMTSQLAGIGGTLLLGIILGGWMLLKKSAIFSLITQLAAFSPRMEEDILENFQLSRRCFSSFITGQLTEALILGGGCLAGMLLFQKPLAGLISLIIAITALVPVAGALVGGALGVLLLTGQSPADGLWFLIFIVLLQLLENNLIYPRVMGHSVGLPAPLVLIAVLAGGTLLGIPGMLLAVPTASVLWQRLCQLSKKRNRQSLTESPPSCYAGTDNR